MQNIYKFRFKKNCFDKKIKFIFVPVFHGTFKAIICLFTYFCKVIFHLPINVSNWEHGSLKN